ncbi:unnamed protein product [Brassicogethes aeneus]|uniref:Rhythmically expressed gene 5 protein n=1 Tax=Brassicogethes aeneus TaxID=1431903 RepID=A0A9P0FBA1_BRAAE|nr:unnamed protein product [Brassicogethes aeneus]
MCGKFMFLLFFVSANLGVIRSSAIPMWEYLKKEEKMSYIYSMFANQVEDFCDTITMENCNKELLKYGLDKLKVMSEDHLDGMDPYQRNANAIIWGSMMDGHKMMKTTPKPKVTTTAKPNSYDDESFGDDFGDFGAQGSASAKIDNVYRVPPPKGFVYQAQSGTPVYTYPHNMVPYLSQFDKARRNQNNNQNTAYTRFQNQYSSTTTSTEKPQVNYQELPLTGPMVVRVYPDGTPVREPQRYPQDDDLRQYQLSKIKIPNF